MPSSSISIPSLLNKVSIDPIPNKPAISEADLWNHRHTGLHQTKSGQFIVSSLAKAKRKRILDHQYKRLMQVFQVTDTPSSEVRSQLAKELDMTNREVQVWFQNRRAKARNKLIQDATKSDNNNQRFIHHYAQSDPQPYTTSTIPQRRPVDLDSL